MSCWNKKEDRIEIGMFNQKEGIIDECNNIVIDHFNILEQCSIQRKNYSQFFTNSQIIITGYYNRSIPSFIN